MEVFKLIDQTDTTPSVTWWTLLFTTLCLNLYKKMKKLRLRHLIRNPRNLWDSLWRTINSKLVSVSNYSKRSKTSLTGSLVLSVKALVNKRQVFMWLSLLELACSPLWTLLQESLETLSHRLKEVESTSHQPSTLQLITNSNLFSICRSLMSRLLLALLSAKLWKISAIDMNWKTSS